MSYGLMRWRLICLVLMASRMSGGNQVVSTKISQAWWWEFHGLRLHECCKCWRVIFHWGRHELHVLWNTEAEQDHLPPETGSQGSVPAWQWFQTHLQDDHCFTEEAEGKAGQACLLTWTHRTSLGDPQAVGGGVQSLKYQLHDVVMEEWKSIPVATCEALVNSMSRRVRGVLGNDGGHTKTLTIDMVYVNIDNFP